MTSMLPLEIVGLDRPDVTFVWEDEHRSVFTARELRLRCRCALCIHEMTGAKLIDPAKIPDDVQARGMALVGLYAVGIRWSDGHDTGLYNFRDLRESCPCRTCTGNRAGQ